jgi:hypothetical protein
MFFHVVPKFQLPFDQVLYFLNKLRLWTDLGEDQRLDDGTQIELKLENIQEYKWGKEELEGE